MKKVVTFGEIMLRLNPPGYLRFGQARSFDVAFGGGEANVSASLANFGMAAEDPLHARLRIRQRDFPGEGIRGGDLQDLPRQGGGWGRHS